METVIEKAESHWALRFVGSNRDQMRWFQVKISRASVTVLTTLGMARLLSVVRIVPIGTVHRYKNGWSLTFCANTKSEAQAIESTIAVLLDRHGVRKSLASATQSMLMT